MSELHEGQRLPRWPERLLGVLGGLLFLVTFVSIVAGMLARFFGQSGLEWSFEIAGIGFIWVTFIGTVIAEWRNENVCFDGVVKLLPARVQRALDVFSALLLAGIGGWLLYSAYAVLVRSAWVPTPVLRWPTGLTIMALVSCSAMLLLIALVRLVRGVSGGVRSPEVRA